MKKKQKPSQPQVEVKQNPDAPVPTVVLAEHILAIGTYFKAALNAGLKKETLVTLISDHSRVAKTHVRLVLNNLEQLAELHLVKRQ